MWECQEGTHIKKAAPSERPHRAYTTGALCVIIFALSQPSNPDNGKGVLSLEYVIAFLISVVAGVVANYICKWLD